MSCSILFNQSCLRWNITIVPDNARCHSWKDYKRGEDEGERSCSGSSCCASLHSCDSESSVDDSALSHKLKCRWETDACPHSNCCPKQPCRRSADEFQDHNYSTAPPAPPTRSFSDEKVRMPSSHHHEHLKQQDSSSTSDQIIPREPQRQKQCRHDDPQHHHHTHHGPAHTRHSSPVPDVPKQVFSKTA